MILNIILAYLIIGGLFAYSASKVVLKAQEDGELPEGNALIWVLYNLQVMITWPMFAIPFLLGMSRRTKGDDSE